MADKPGGDLSADDCVTPTDEHVKSVARWVDGLGLEMGGIPGDLGKLREYLARLVLLAQASLRQRIQELERACSVQQEEVQQTLGKALGYPWFKDDQKTFPGATEADGVCVGENIAETLAEEAARRIAAQDESVKRCAGVILRWAEWEQALLADNGIFPDDPSGPAQVVLTGPHILGLLKLHTERERVMAFAGQLRAEWLPGGLPLTEATLREALATETARAQRLRVAMESIEHSADNTADAFPDLCGRPPAEQLAEVLDRIGDMAREGLRPFREELWPDRDGSRGITSDVQAESSGSAKGPFEKGA